MKAMPYIGFSNTIHLIVLGKIIKKRGVIVNVLPSIAFIKVEGKSLQVSLQQLKNVCNKTANSQVEIIYKNSSIIDIVDIK